MSPAIVRVALPVPLPQCFDYTAESIAPGDLGRCVRVPFGRGEKTGLIVALPDAAELPVERLKPVIAIQREAPALPADWLLSKNAFKRAVGRLYKEHRVEITERSIRKVD